MPEASEISIRCERFLAEQSTSRADIGTLIETLRNASARSQEALVGSG